MRLVVLFLIVASTLPSAAQSRRRAVARTLPAPTVVDVQDDFRNGQLGWTAGFADYSPVNDGMELDSGMRPLPAELSTPGTAFFITGHNRSDDLFMFLSKKLTAADGIAPGQRYRVSFRVTVASNAGNGCVGIGGSPGDGVYLKVGATGVEPHVSLDDGNHFRVNFDKGQQSQSGTAASVAGTIGNGTSNCSGEAPFVSITRAHQHTDTVMSNAFGELWLVIGTDSAFEGKTTLYYQAVEATLTPVS